MRFVTSLQITMTKILSKRGRAERSQLDAEKRRLEKFQIAELPLTAEEQEHIRRIFDNIRRQLEQIGG